MFPGQFKGVESRPLCPIAQRLLCSHLVRRLRCADRLLKPARRPSRPGRRAERRTATALKRPELNTQESIRQKAARRQRSSGHITAFSEDDTGFIGRKKSIHNLLTEAFSCFPPCLLVLLCSDTRYLCLSSHECLRDTALLNDLLCTWPGRANTHSGHGSLTLSRSRVLNWRIHNSAVELLDFQVAATRGKEVISACFF